MDEYDDFIYDDYAILQIEFGRVGAHNRGPKAMSMLDLANPELNWFTIFNELKVLNTVF